MEKKQLQFGVASKQHKRSEERLFLLVDKQEALPYGDQIQSPRFRQSLAKGLFLWETKGQAAFVWFEPVPSVVETFRANRPRSSVSSQ